MNKYVWLRHLKNQLTTFENIITVYCKLNGVKSIRLTTALLVVFFFFLLTTHVLGFRSKTIMNIHLQKHFTFFKINLIIRKDTRFIIYCQCLKFVWIMSTSEKLQLQRDKSWLGGHIKICQIRTDILIYTIINIYKT